MARNKYERVEHKDRTVLISENPGETVIIDRVRGKTLRFRGMVPGGTETMKHHYRISNARAEAGGYAR